MSPEERDIRGLQRDGYAVEPQPLTLVGADGHPETPGVRGAGDKYEEETR